MLTHTLLVLRLHYRRSGVVASTEWCNGNTSPFGGEFLGSSPSSVAQSKKTEGERKHPLIPPQACEERKE